MSAPHEVTDTQFGFDWGPVKVARLYSDDKYGYVLAVRAGKQEVEVRISPAGRVMSVAGPFKAPERPEESVDD